MERTSAGATWLAVGAMSLQGARSHPRDPTGGSGDASPGRTGPRAGSSGSGVLRRRQAVARILAAHAHGTSLVSMSGGLTLAALLGRLGLTSDFSVAVPAVLTRRSRAAGAPPARLVGPRGLQNGNWALRLIPLSALDAASGFRTMLTVGVLALSAACWSSRCSFPRRAGQPADDTRLTTPSRALSTCRRTTTAARAVAAGHHGFWLVAMPAPTRVTAGTARKRVRLTERVASSRLMLSGARIRHASTTSSCNRSDVSTWASRA